MSKIVTNSYQYHENSTCFFFQSQTELSQLELSTPSSSATSVVGCKLRSFASLDARKSRREREREIE